MIIIGLTGGIATGKSTVSEQLKKYGIPIIDADVIAREVVEPGKPAYRQVVTEFGTSVPDLLNEDGQLNRPALGRAVFNSTENRTKLNKIVHPAVRKEIVRQILSNWLRRTPVVVLDVPLLFETKLSMLCDKTVVVVCSKEIQFHRLMQRNSFLSEDDARARIAAQMPLDEKRKRANIVIENNGTQNDLEHVVEYTATHAPFVQPNWTQYFWWVPSFGLLKTFFLYF